MNRITKRSDCPINYGLEIFGDKWTLLLIRDFIFKGKKTYGELQASEERIATNILAQRLAWLKRHKIIHKSPDPQKGSSFVYQLTQKGIDLLPILLEMIAWSWKYDAQTATPASFAKQLLTNKEKLKIEILSALREGRQAA